MEDCIKRAAVRETLPRKLENPLTSFHGSTTGRGSKQAPQISLPEYSQKPGGFENAFADNRALPQSAHTELGV